MASEQQCPECKNYRLKQVGKHARMRCENCGWDGYLSEEEEDEDDDDKGDADNDSRTM